ncbi:hypothetical protein J7L70_08825 [Candidatus Bathyarchaeota archaeon]|nr:hypothetical protein [Candidatus Bathyarchaeota archaeon]
MKPDETAYRVFMVGMIVSVLLLATSLLSNLLQLERGFTSTIATVSVGVLISTPYAVVASIIVVSALNRDRNLLLVSTIVLTVMIMSLLLGLVLRAP